MNFKTEWGKMRNDRKAIIFAGVNGAGKSTFYNMLQDIPDFKETIRINTDEILTPSPFLSSGGSIVYVAYARFTQDSYWFPWTLPLPPVKWISQVFTFFQAYALTQPLSPMAETPVIHLRLARQCHAFIYIKKNLYRFTTYIKF